MLQKHFNCFVFSFLVQKSEFGSTVFPILQGKGLELSLWRRFQSRYLKESVSMLQFNTHGQGVREPDCESGINRTEKDEFGKDGDGVKDVMVEE